MRWLLASAAMLLSVGTAAASLADDASASGDQAQGGTGSATAPSELEQMAPASGGSAAAPDTDNTRDALDITGGRAVLAAGAHSADDIIGADVIGPTGDPVGTVDDLVLGSDGAVEQVVVTDAGVFNMAGKRVAVDFTAAAVIEGGDDEDTTLRIDLSDDALEQAAEFDEDQLEGQGDLLATALLDREVELSAGDADGEIEDLLIGADGRVQYALVAFPGMFDAEDDLVVVEIHQIVAANPDQPPTLSMTEAEIRSAPRYGRPEAAAATQ